MTAVSARSDFRDFFRSWRVDPRRVGAVLPSGDALSRLITCEIDPDHGPVLELGAGTGVFTHALIARGIKEADLILVETGDDFARMLGERFPGARVLRHDAARLAGPDLFPEGPLGAVVSGLPLLSMTPRAVMATLAGAFTHVRADGAFYQFTYGPRCPVPRAMLDRLGLQAACLGRAWRNLPPAAVYRITRRPGFGSMRLAARSLTIAADRDWPAAPPSPHMDDSPAIAAE